MVRLTRTKIFIIGLKIAQQGKTKVELDLAAAQWKWARVADMAFLGFRWNGFGLHM